MTTRSAPSRAVYDSGHKYPDGVPRGGGYAGLGILFHRDERDRRRGKPVAFPGDPPSDLAERRALAEAGNPDLAQTRRHNLENVRKYNG